jgi:hypothetical protein
MRLDPTEVVHLPLAAALLDWRGAVVASTPEWRGAAPGSACYDAGQFRLLVGHDISAWPEQEVVVSRLVAELRAATAAMPREQAVCAAVLSSGLELVAGWPPRPEAAGTAPEVLERAAIAIRARVPGVEVRVAEAPDQPVPAPDQVALALLQYAANAFTHDRAATVRLRAAAGPSLFVEWPATRPADAVAAGQSHPALRRRWGLGYVRMVADYLGATPLSVGPTAPGWTGACVSLGHRRLTLPLALFAGGRRVRSSQTWEQGTRSLDPAVAEAIRSDLGAALSAASSHPGAIVRPRLLSARLTAGRTWVALPPETGTERARDVLRGLDHERELWAAPEPYATRLHGLIHVLRRSLGVAPVAFAPEAFEREIPRACATLGVPPPPHGPVLICPDPRVTAFLLAELGGVLVAEPSATFLVPGPAAPESPFPALLGADGRGWIRLTPA